MIEDVALFDTDAWLRFSLIQTSLQESVGKSPPSLHREIHFSDSLLQRGDDS